MKTISTKKRYHHGNLEQELLNAALRSVAVDGLQKLSLRHLAQEIGVSHNAPYQHFPDKESLIAVLAERGFRLLGDAMEEATQAIPPSDPIARLVALSQSYVEFMAKNPAYLEIMFGSFPHMDYPSLSTAAMATLDKLVGLITEGQAQGVFRAGDVRLMAGSVWAMVHGASGIFVAQKFSSLTAEVDAPAKLTTAFIMFLCDGLRT